MWAQLQPPVNMETHSTSFLFLQDSVPGGSLIAIDTAPTYTIDKAQDIGITSIETAVQDNKTTESPQTIVEEK